MSIREGGPLKRDGEWQTFNGMLFTVLAMTSSHRKKIMQDRVKLKTILLIKLLN